MANKPSRTDTVGISEYFHQETRRRLQKSKAKRIANEKWQVRKLFNEWCLITPRGELIMTGTAEHMRHWAFRMVRISNDASKPF